MRVVVIGGGIVGVAAAYRLADAGSSVTLIERGERLGAETSFANAGQISPTLAGPWAVPGLLGKAAKWAFMQHPPLRLRRIDPATAGWLWRMLRAATPERFVASKRAMVELSMLSLAEMQNARREAGLDYPRGGDGTLVLLRDAAMAAAYEADLAILGDLGLPFERLSREAVLAREPNLSRTVPFVGAILLTADETGDCFAATQGLAALAAARGAVLRLGTPASSLAVEGGRVRAVRTPDGDLDCDAVVVSAGTWTADLLRPLGLRLPIVPLKGYSLTIDHPPDAEGPVSTVSDELYKVGVTHLGDRIRVGGTAELAGFDRSAPPARFAALEHVVRELFPKVPEAAIAGAGRWTGLRPSTPDGPPVIGRLARLPNVIVNAGHGTLGWTMAMGSAAVVEAMLAERAPPLDVIPFAPSRFAA